MAKVKPTDIFEPVYSGWAMALKFFSQALGANGPSQLLSRNSSKSFPLMVMGAVAEPRILPYVAYRFRKGNNQTSALICKLLLSARAVPNCTKSISAISAISSPGKPTFRFFSTKSCLMALGIMPRPKVLGNSKPKSRTLCAKNGKALGQITLSPCSSNNGVPMSRLSNVANCSDTAILLSSIHWQSFAGTAISAAFI